MNMFLFQNFQVRFILVGDRPCPFVECSRLKQCWDALGDPDWEFDPSTTFVMLEKIKSDDHTDFHQELTESFWFGGVMSYGNIMREVYTIIHGWMEAIDPPDVEGLCEVDDGVTFHMIVIDSLRIVREKHAHEIISRLYTKLDANKLFFPLTVPSTSHS